MQGGKTWVIFALVLCGWLFRKPVVVVVGSGASVTAAVRLRLFIQAKLDSILAYVKTVYDVEGVLSLDVLLAKKNEIKAYADRFGRE